MKSDNSKAGKDGRKNGFYSLLDYIWDTELSSVSGLRRLGVKIMRVMHLICRGFRDDDCALHASALTFSTLMAIVPVLALSLALARGFGNVDVAKEKIRDVVVEWTSGFKSTAALDLPVTGLRKDASVSRQAASGPVAETCDSAPGIAKAINSMVDRVFEKVDNIKFKAIGGVGLVILILMVIDVLGQVESSFNRVWAVKSSRTILRKFTDYLSVLIVLPVLMIAASSLPIVSFATRFLDETVAEGLRFWVGSAAVKDVTMIVMATLGFTFLLVFMPNTKVKLGPGLAGGFVTALLFICWLWICAALQVGVANYGKIYGSFAMIPILLAWVYTSWGIVLFGAEVSFSVQNCTSYRMEQGARKANVQARIILALSIVLEAARGMIGKGNGFETSWYAEQKRIPVRFINEVLDELKEAGLVAELSGNAGRFVLLKSPDSVKVKDVVDVIMLSGAEPRALGLGSVDPEVQRIVNMASEGVSASLSKTSVRDLMSQG